METISISEGLLLTIVSMIVVFAILTVIWGLVELTSKVLANSDEANQVATETAAPQLKPVSQTNTASLAANEKNQKVAEIIALILASEDKPNKKFEISESKRVK